MKPFVASLALTIAASAFACGGGNDDSTDGDDWLALIPLAPGAEETDRTVEDAIVTVMYETDASLTETANHYRVAMSVPPWRVTTYDLDHVQGNADIVFRSDEDALLANAQVNTQTDAPTTIRMTVEPIIARDGLTPTATPSPEATE